MVAVLAVVLLNLAGVMGVMAAVLRLLAAVALAVTQEMAVAKIAVALAVAVAVEQVCREIMARVAAALDFWEKALAGVLVKGVLVVAMALTPEVLVVLLAVAVSMEAAEVVSQ